MLSFHHGICGVFNLLDFLVIGLAASSIWNFEHQTCFPCTLTYTARGGSKKKARQDHFSDHGFLSSIMGSETRQVSFPFNPPLNHSGI